MHETAKNGSIDLSVVIPSKNEGANLDLLLPDLHQALEELDIQSEVLVVDAASADGTPDIVASHGARYLREKGRGYGHAILTGVAAARGQYILTMDADHSHPTRFVRELWAARGAGDLVIASRYVEGGGADQPFFRLLLSKILNAFFRFGLSIPVQDMSSGFRLYNRRVFDGIEIQFTTFVFLVELLLKTMQRGGHIAEVPFHYAPRGEGVSNARIIQFGVDYCRLFYQVWKLRNACNFPDYDWRARKSRIPLQRWWHAQRTRHILRFAGTEHPVIDIGCGSARMTMSYPEGSVAVDWNMDKLRFMRPHLPNLVQSDGTRLGLADACTNVVVCSQVLEHVPDDGVAMLDELVRILKPGGTLVLGTPDYGRWEWRVTERLYDLAAPGAYAEEHITHYDYGRLERALNDRGITVLDHAYVGRGELIMQCRKERA
jgi:glycosyltransferase involved in cell wall biosynthesis